MQFGYELIEFIVDKYSNNEIIILENNNEKKDLKEKIVDDMLQIMNIFVAKINDVRKYKKLNKNLKCKEISTLVLLLTPLKIKIYHVLRKNTLV